MRKSEKRKLLLERYRNIKFKFLNYKEGKFYYSPICRNFILDEDLLVFTPRASAKVLSKMSYRRILSESERFPEIFLDEEFLVNPISGLEDYWNSNFEEFLIRQRYIFGFEGTILLFRLVSTSPYSYKLQNLDEVKFYHAMYVLKHTPVEFFKNSRKFFSQELLDKLNSLGIYLAGQKLNSRHLL